jgi:3-phenylpropionate/cinnamic acid dioxygenase small subunit
LGSVEDRFAIMELLAQYATILDDKHFDGVFDVFTDTVRWDFESVGAGPATVMSPAGIKAWLLPGFTGFVATHHAITNHRIDVDGDRATIRAHFHAEHWIDPAEAGDGPQCWVAVGFYDDEAVRTVDGWRISSVRVTLTHSTGIEVVPIANAAGERILAAAAAESGS